VPDLYAQDLQDRPELIERDRLFENQRGKWTKATEARQVAQGAATARARKPRLSGFGI
jgi:hypothetical protein